MVVLLPLRRMVLGARSRSRARVAMVSGHLFDPIHISAMKTSAQDAIIVMELLALGRIYHHTLFPGVGSLS